MKKTKEYSFISSTSGRLDSISSLELNIPRSIFSDDSTLILLNGKKAKKSSKIKENDRVEIRYVEETFEGLKKEDIPLDIIYEDDDILVINKEQGMVVHPGSGVNEGTLCNALLNLYGEDFSTSDDSVRPGIVHRLDKDTSGVMVIAKNREAHLALTKEFSEHTNEKYYCAIAKGFFSESSGYIERRIVRDKNNRKKFTVTDNKSEGKDALTKFRVISQNSEYAFLILRLYTGRTHQIRVHLSSINHPVLGDPIYSRVDKKYKDATLMLHSLRLVIHHPRSGEKMVFRAPLPERFNEILESEGLKKDDLVI